MELGRGEEEIEWIMNECVHEDWIYRLSSILEWTTLGVGFDIREGIEGDDEDVHELVPLMHWAIRVNKDQRRAQAAIRWDTLRFFLQEKEMELRGNSSKAERNTGRPRKRKLSSKAVVRSGGKSGWYVSAGSFGCAG
ncbi:uncharacterized protein LOC131048637 [Cryptomeria japonica]|uniref:uncharacterized protein LOC131048637 n=1 Tax=Cryptomeria japonica TaxID=3369 RepID=UPI0027DA0FAB|nr:uncharacterized protein LOC131048637 [Cryptomeria japonica]